MSSTGRTRKYSEPLCVRVPVLFTQGQNAQLEGKVGSGDVSSHIRDVVLRDLEGAARIGEDNMSLPVIARPPCGDWAEAVADTETSFGLNSGVAREMDAHADDFFIRARGQSMVGTGILDGSLVLMRQLPQGRDPRRGDIVLVQVALDDGTMESTVKRWSSHSGEPPALEDGNGDAFALPANAVEVMAVACARGVIGVF